MLTIEPHAPVLRRGDYVGGSFIKPALVTNRFTSVNPSNNTDIIASYLCSTSSVDQAIVAAVAGAAQWKNTPLDERVNALKQLRARILAQASTLSALLTRETGVTVKDAKTEVIAASRAVDLLIEAAADQLAPTVLSSLTARSDRFPRGVVAIITPFTSPILTTVLQVTAALLSGNSVVLKPSSRAATVGQHFAQLIDSLRLPRGVFNMVQGTGKTIGHRLVTNPNVNAVLFSGTYSHACDVQQALVGRPEVPLFVETGGKGAAIVLASCDVQQAAFESLSGTTQNAGQLPNCVGRVFVMSEAYPQFMQRLTALISELKVGRADSPSTQMGPLISKAATTAYFQFADTVTAAGHEITVPPTLAKSGDDPGHFVTPAVYTINWENGKGLLDSTPPGPSLLIYKVSTAAEAISLYNRLRYRPCVALYTDKSLADLQALASTLKAGAININRGATSSSMRLPAVPHGHSSNGLSSGLNLLSSLSTPRAYLVEARPK